MDENTDDDTDNKFVEISDVLETGANDVYDIETVLGEHVLVPAIKDCILYIHKAI